MDTCPICLDNTATVTIECNHSFCETCIKRWLPNIKFKLGTCPVCRSDITSIENLKCTDNPSESKVIYFDPKKYWSVNTLDVTVPSKYVFKFVKKSLPTISQIMNRYTQHQTDHILIEIKWSQLDPFIKRQTRNTPKRKEKNVIASLYIGPNISTNYPFSYDNNILNIITYDETNENKHIIFEGNVKCVVDTFLKKMLTPSDDGPNLADNLSLRPIHSGMVVTIFDGKRFIHTETMRLTVN